MPPRNWPKKGIAVRRQPPRQLQESLEAGFVDVVQAGDTASEEHATSPTPLMTTEAFWEAIQRSATARVVLPDGETDLERASARFVQELTSEQWIQLDQA